MFVKPRTHDQHVLANMCWRTKVCRVLKKLANILCWPTMLRTCSFFVGQQMANRALWLVGCSKHHDGRIVGCILCWLRKLYFSILPLHDPPLHPNRFRAPMFSSYEQLNKSLLQQRRRRLLSPPFLPYCCPTKCSHLHWLPVHRRIQFKIAVITYKTLSTDQPPYLRNLLNPYRPSRSLRSANRNLLLIPPHNTNFSRRAFSFAAPTVWNKLATGIRDSNTLHTFKHRLKTFFTSHPS